MSLLRALGARLIREPVLLFGAMGAVIAAWLPFLVDTEVETAAVAAVLLWLQRSFSTSKANAADQIADASEKARAEALADVASLQAPRKATKRPTKKAARG